MSEATNVVQHPSAKGGGGLVAALIAAQRKFKAAIKEAENPHFQSKFVDLAGAWDACREALWDQGLTVEQFTRVQATGPVLVTRLDHVSGESREGEYPLVPSKDRDPQALGAAMTYARRYCLMAMVGMAPEDDDGNTASEKPKAPPAPKAAKSAAPANTTGKAASPPSERPWMKKLQAVVGSLKLGEAEAERRGLRGEPRQNYIRGARLMYLSWCAGREINSTTELTDTEADTAIRRAELGEMPE